MIADEGDLRRRDAFASIATAYPLTFPAGYRYIEDSLDAWDDGVSLGNVVTAIYVGCDEPFDAILWGLCDIAPATVLANLVLEVSYGRRVDEVDTWVPLPWHFDSTGSHRNLFDSWYRTPLSRTGVISWHRSTLVDADGESLWTETEMPLHAEDHYQIRLRLLGASDGVAKSFQPEVLAPGLRPVLFSAVNGLMPARLRGGRRVLVVGSDQAERRGAGGATLGLVPGPHKPTKRLLLSKQVGAGVIGVRLWPQYQQLIAGVWTNQGAPAIPSVGTAGTLTRGDPTANAFLVEREEWAIDEWLGGVIAQDLVPLGASTFASFQTSTIDDVPEGRYEHYRLVCTSQPTTGPDVGETQEVVASSSAGGVTTLILYPGFSADPETDQTFDLRAPPAVVRVEAEDRSRDYEPSDSDSTKITLSTEPYAPALASAHDTAPVHFDLGLDPRFSIRAGHRWCHTYDPVTGRMLLTNGESGILSFDGRRLMRMVADTTSTYAKKISGTLPDVDGRLPSEQIKAPFSSLLSAPPPGRYVIDYRGRIVVAHMPGRPNDLMWSEPNDYINVWPFRNYTMVRDGANQPISGLANLAGRLIAFTANSIHEGQAGGAPETIFWEPRSAGVGFIAHHAVSVISLAGSEALIGANADGVYIYNGADPSPALDSWERLLPGGINQSALPGAVAASWLSRSLWFCAVPSAGSSVNDRIAVYDYAANTWWLWTAPYGISSMAREFDSGGVETILFGTNDGHVMTLIDAETDDGKEIDGNAVSPPVRPFGAHEGDFESFQLGMRGMGDTEAARFRIHVNGNATPWQESAIYPISGLPRFGVTEFSDAEDAADSPRYAAEPHVTVRVPARAVPNATQIQYAIGGTTRWALRAAEATARPRVSRG